MFSVSQVNAYIKQLFVKDYVINDIWIKGEISNLKKHTSGHIYFTLKDDTAALSCVIFRSSRQYIDCDLQNGMTISARGYISVYERAGSYQFYVQQAQKDGIGVLYQKYEQLKQKLQQLGYFEETLKKAIPRYPKKVGIVTSDTGAAIRDIIQISKRRNPYIHLVLYASLVQGSDAAANIIQGIQYLDMRQDIDVIIIGRGGGSIEDLWAFNEEGVAHAIYTSHTPIISAVGHETDFTISDFVSDLRAATPSAAAELAVPAYRDLVNQFESYQSKLYSSINNQLQKHKKDMELYSVKFELNSPERKAKQEYQYVYELKERLSQELKRKMQDKINAIHLFQEKLEVLSPLHNLEKGYAYITDEENKNIHRIKQLDIGQDVIIKLLDGDIRASVKEINKKVWDEIG